MIPHETAAESTYVYRGRIINVRKDAVVFPNGQESSREIVEHRGGVAVAALDGEGRLCLVRQFRYAFGEELLEIPAGKIEEGEGGQLTEAAMRELREETGFTAGSMELLGVIYPSVGILTEKIYIYFARDLSEGEANPDPDEFLNVLWIPTAEVGDMIQSGEIRDAKTICAFYYLKNKNLINIPVSEV